MTLADLDPDAAWQAIKTRDAAWDGRLWYAVRTTGIYCRPTCPARRPRRDNVALYPTATAAARAGYRACRRCRPDLAASPTASGSALVAAACRTIAAAETRPPLATLAAGAGLSPWHFHRLFKAVTGTTPVRYGMAVRAGRVVAALTGAGTDASAGAPADGASDVTVTAALHDSGYGSASRFYAEATGRLGMRPTVVKKCGAGETIRYALHACSLGDLLVAVTDRGVCAILIGDDRAQLTADLAARFAAATLVANDAGFATLLADVVALVEEPGAAVDLPLDIRGTAFQQRVWEALRAIPPGTTVSYADLAARLGRPTAVRAVAGACAANRLAVAIPCHRVVGSNGRLTGYRWGTARKAALLARERARDTPR
jgi:AraC family transcriptional regulator of adaptative response/methylated-DNA-[protein]-cysteine methyltransferase